MSQRAPEAESEGPEGYVAPSGDGGRVAIYERADQARIAIKLLTARGFPAKRLYVLCSDEKRREEFRSRLVPSGSPQLNTATSVMGVGGAATLGGLLGGAAALVSWPVAVAAGAFGAVFGGAVGAMLGHATQSDDETRRLLERYETALQSGAILVVVAPGDGGEEPGMDIAEECLVEAVDPM